MSLLRTVTGAPAPDTGRTTILSGALVALFLANLLNFFDRSIPSVVERSSTNSPSVTCSWA